jgi:hypothetical protein
VHFRFDSGTATVSGQDRVPCPWISNASDRDLIPPRDGRWKAGAKAAQETNLAQIPKAHTAWKRPDRQVEADNGSQSRGQVDRQVAHKASLDPAEVRMRDPGGSRNALLAEPRQASGIPKVSS